MILEYSVFFHFFPFCVSVQTCLLPRSQAYGFLGCSGPMEGIFIAATLSSNFSSFPLFT